jgi:hypothetical protein
MQCEILILALITLLVSVSVLGGCAVCKWTAFMCCWWGDDGERFPPFPCGVKCSKLMENVMVEMVTRSRWLHERSEVAQRQCSDQTVGVERFLFNFCAVSFDLAWRDRTKTKVFFFAEWKRKGVCRELQGRFAASFVSFDQNSTWSIFALTSDGFALVAWWHRPLLIEHPWLMRRSRRMTHYRPSTVSCRFPTFFYRWWWRLPHTRQPSIPNLTWGLPHTRQPSIPNLTWAPPSLHHFVSPSTVLRHGRGRPGWHAESARSCPHATSRHAAFQDDHSFGPIPSSFRQPSRIPSSFRQPSRPRQNLGHSKHQPPPTTPPPPSTRHQPAARAQRGSANPSSTRICTRHKDADAGVGVEQEARLQRPLLRYGCATQSKKGEDFFLLRTDCLRPSTTAASPHPTFAVFTVCGISTLRDRAG